MNCALCSPNQEKIIWQNQYVRIIDAQEAHYPQFVRVIWQKHIKEMSELSFAELEILMHCIRIIEKIMIDELKPHKVNMAQLGNQVPHLHWHLIPRYPEDAHFPQPVWANTNEARIASIEYQDWLSHQKTLTKNFHHRIRQAFESDTQS